MSESLEPAEISTGLTIGFSLTKMMLLLYYGWKH